jgi:hypothetical protein
MLTFKAPQYTKTTNPKTGTQDATYIFSIEGDTDESLSFMADNESDISLKSLQKCILDNLNWWNTFVRHFLDSSSKYFSKPYTVEAINKITKHTLDGTKILTFPVNIILIPKNIKISGGIFTVNWTYEVGRMIDIPDLTDESDNINEVISPPVSNNKVIEGIQELNLDDLPVGNESTDETLDLDSPTKFYDKQRVKEARLKAKLALYKAQRQMAMYYDKYGSDISDSESEYNSSDEENYEDDEVQL